MGRIRFSLNDGVYVKLTESGYQLWLDYYNKYSNIVTLDELKRRERNGKVRFQLHELISVFGSSINFGSRCEVFDTLYLEMDSTDYELLNTPKTNAK